MKPIQSFLQEKYIISSKNYMHNFKDWKSGKADKIFIVGISGSGKSALGKKLAEGSKSKYISLDTLGWKISKEINKFLVIATPYKKYQKILFGRMEETLKKLKNRTVIEGVEVMRLNFKYVSSYPIIILNTSILKSTMRAYFRNRKEYNDPVIDTIVDLYFNQSVFIKHLDDFTNKLKALDK